MKDILKSVPDPRGRQGRDYELWSLLSLVIVAFLCGRRGLAAAFRMGRKLTREQRERLGFGLRMPCHSTLTETMGLIDADALADLFGSLVMVEDADTRHISIDGKTMRASKDGQGRAMHCVSAFCLGLQQVLNHTASAGKGLEIPDALALLDKLDLRGKIVTADALMCQKSIVAKVLEKGGDYVLPVKDNQATLRQDIETAFETPVFPPGVLRGSAS